MNIKHPRSLFLILIILLGSIGAGVGFNMYNQTHEGLKDVEPDFRLDPITLYSAFEGNERKANEHYLGKVIEIEGAIGTIEFPANGPTNIVIKTLEDSFGGINCSFTELDSSRLRTLKQGDLVKLRGECSGYLMDVNLVRCVLIFS